MRSVLVDTHVALWAAADPDRLSDSQREVLEDPTTEILFSTVSVAEIEIKRSIGKLATHLTCDDLRASIIAEWLPLRANHAMTLRSLPLLHRDPFDRMLIAQAIADSLEFVTSDAQIADYASAGLRLLGAPAG